MNKRIIDHADVVSVRQGTCAHTRLENSNQIHFDDVVEKEMSREL